MKATELELAGVLLLQPAVFSDQRGEFLETWHRQRYEDVGISRKFVQDNVSRSRSGVIRGLHFQHPNGQGKLVSTLNGEIFDVAVDVRRDSPTFGKWIGRNLSAGNACQLFIPEGFAHGFAVLSETAIVSYKCTAFYAPESETTLLWNDPGVAIEWPIGNPLLSAKDAAGLRLTEIASERLPKVEGGAGYGGL